MDRRHFVMTGSLALGAGALPSTAARAATVPTLRGPYVDLTTGKGNMLTLARMNSNFDEGKVKYGSASGTVFGVRPGEAIRDLFGAEVVSSARAWKQPDGSYRVLHRETVLYTDLKSGEVLGEFQNPYTNERVKVVDVVNDPWNETFEEFDARRPPSAARTRRPRRTQAHGAAVARARRRPDRRDALHPPRLPERAAAGQVAPRVAPARSPRSSEMFAYIVPLKDLQNPKITSLRLHRHLVRSRRGCPGC